MKKRISKKTIIETILLVLLISCLSCNIITGIAGKSHIFGFKPILVMSGSMEPTINTYQFVIAKPISAEELKINDIVTYRAANGLTIIHRIIEINDEGFIFKGDANEEADENIVTAEQIGYKVIWY